jgi:endogenous inhibitor of DNA gyrase (YacG/DUF329 family)
MIDLGAWASDAYRVSVAQPDQSSDEPVPRPGGDPPSR